MSVIPIDLRPKSARRRSPWREFVERLDALLAYPARHVVSDQELRRIDEDIKRCRELMFRATSETGYDINHGNGSAGGSKPQPRPMTNSNQHG